MANFRKFGNKLINLDLVSSVVLCLNEQDETEVEINLSASSWATLRIVLRKEDAEEFIKWCEAV